MSQHLDEIAKHNPDIALHYKVYNLKFDHPYLKYNVAKY